MKIAILVSMLIAGSAFADCSSDLVGPFPAGQASQLCNTFPDLTTAQSVTGLKTFSGGITSNGVTVPAGYGVTQPASTIIFALTPVAATNALAPGLNVPSLVATPVANAAVFVGPATPIPGQRFTINNSSTATLKLKAAGAALMNNAGSAGGIVNLSTLQSAECKTISTTSQICIPSALPTPQ